MSSLINPLTDEYAKQIAATPEVKRVGLLTPDGLCDRWSKPFVKRDIETVCIPIGQTEAIDVLDKFDALLLPGGRSNIHPFSCGSEDEPIEDEFYHRGRDKFSASLIKKAYELDLPTLGICRGMQEIVAAFGGIIRKLPTEPYNHARGYKHEGDLDKMDELVHPFEVRPGGLFQRLFGLEERQVNSIHRYGTTREDWTLSDTFFVEAVAPDGVIEAISAMDKRFFLGTQAHFEFAGEMHDAVFGEYFKQIDAHHQERIKTLGL